MSLTEISEKSFLSLGRLHRKEALFFSTPLCGTCKVAERMLAIAAAAPGAMPVAKLNVNFAPQLRERWRVTSVPALVVLEDGQPVRIVYAMRSVGDLYEALRLQEQD
ncbi:Thioredoxin [Paenibacillaceae bacterium GAS479]|nr:Thioredoxin [Paenibacillaceae bacterium GAS479]